MESVLKDSHVVLSECCIVGKGNSDCSSGQKNECISLHLIEKKMAPTGKK
jgi:hypothetical protein